MLVSETNVAELGSAGECASPGVLGNVVTVDLEVFPELGWIRDYLSALGELQAECDRISSEIRAIEQEGEVYRDMWIEPYTKYKGGKEYTYYQLRWLTGERRKSGQPKVKTKHLSHRVVGEVRGAIERGKQVESLEQQQQLIEEEVVRLRQLVQGVGRRTKKARSLNSME